MNNVLQNFGDKGKQGDGPVVWDNRSTPRFVNWGHVGSLPVGRDLAQAEGAVEESSESWSDGGGCVPKHAAGDTIGPEAVFSCKKRANDGPPLLYK